MSELLFEKEYELLQEITYSDNGSAKQTKKVLLKAPTFKQSEKIEAAMRSIDPITATLNFICDAGLIVVEDTEVCITRGWLGELHIKAYRDLANNYCKFFLASDSLEEEKR